MTAKKIQDNLKIEISQLNDQNLISIAWMVSRFPPFYTYSFGLMLDKIYEQLKNSSNITVSVDNQLVAYGGWFIADLQATEDWQRNGLELLPLPKEGGGAVIVTIVVSKKPEYLRPLAKAILHVSAGKKVFRKRTFVDDRPDINRPPLNGRLQRSL